MVTDARLEAEIERVTREIEEWCEENIVGQFSTARLQDEVPHIVVARIAQGLGVASDRVRLTNPRWTQEGRVFLCDGFEVLPLRTEPILVSVACSQWASCGWTGKRISDRLGVQPKPCPRCGKEVVR